MKVIFLLCAESATVDTARNTLSVFHIIEEFNSPSFPFVVPALYICALLEKPLDEPEPEGVEVKLQVDNRELLVNPLQMQFGDKPRLRAITGIGGLIIPSPGSLIVSLNQGGMQLAAWKMQIINIGQPKIQPELPMSPIHVDPEKASDERS